MRHSNFYLLIILLLAAPFVGCTTAPVHQATHLLNPAPPPLAIDPAFAFRKTQLLFINEEAYPADTDQVLVFERNRILYGAVNELERSNRYGNYFRFFWRTDRIADVTVRLEYRQANLGPKVQALELSYSGAMGSVKSEFAVIGDDYLQDGRVSAWRALIIENGRVVALTQSALWQ